MAVISGFCGWARSATRSTASSSPTRAPSATVERSSSRALPPQGGALAHRGQLRAGPALALGRRAAERAGGGDPQQDRRLAAVQGSAGADRAAEGRRRRGPAARPRTRPRRRPPPASPRPSRRRPEEAPSRSQGGRSRGPGRGRLRPRRPRRGRSPRSRPVPPPARRPDACSRRPSSTWSRASSSNPDEVRVRLSTAAGASASRSGSTRRTSAP